MNVLRFALSILMLALAVTACETPSEPEIPRPAARLQIRPDSLHFNVFSSHAAVQVTAWDTSGHVIVQPTVAWQLVGDPVVSVTSAGLVEARQNGKARLIASATIPGGITVADTIPIVVRQIVAGVVIVPTRLGLYEGDTTRLIAFAYDSLRWPVRDAAFTWQSSGPGVLSIDPSGAVKALAPGVASASVRTATFAGNTTISESAPMSVVAEGVYIQVTSGAAHSCSLLRSGEVYCWGERGGGMLTDGTRLSGDVPLRVAGTDPFVSIDAGYFHTCALTATGAAFCWGGNLFGQLGNGDGGTEQSRRDTPQPVTGSRTFTRLTTGVTHTCGITTSGETYCWGSNDSGELGSGTPMSGRYNKQPTLVEGSLRLVEISAGDRHTCGITTQGATYCWGSNSQYKLGVAGDSRSTPVRVAEGFVFGSIHAVGNHTCGVTLEKQIYCWGGWADYSGSTVSGRSTPTRIGPGLDLVSVAEGNDSMCGLARDGTAYCWKAGDGSQVVRVPGNIPFTALSPGRDRTCGVSFDRKVYCWGPGGIGGMGDGRPRGTEVPVLVSAPF